MKYKTLIAQVSLFALTAGIAPHALAANEITTSIAAASSNQCLAILGASTAANSVATQATCTNTAEQLWTLRPASTGGYQLVASHSGQCLGVFASAAQVGLQAVQEPCQNVLSQTFHLRPQGAGYALSPRHSNLCLGIEGGATNSGARIVQEVCDGASDTQTWVMANVPARAAKGEWSAVQKMSIVPTAAANLPNGKVLLWSSYDPIGFSEDHGKTYTIIYNPLDATFTQTIVSNTGHDMFCSGISNLADGQILVSGGSSSTKTSLYNPNSNTWVASSPMNIARGYNANVTLNNGDVLTVGGSWKGPQGNKGGELWSANNGQWSTMGANWEPYLATKDSQTLYRADYHMWLFAGANGQVFHAGPSKNMNWINPRSGQVTPAGVRGNDEDAMNGSAIMWDTHKILTLGGAPIHGESWATKNAHVIDISGSTVQARTVSPMANARAFVSGVALPTGHVLAVGGQSYAQPFSDDRAALSPELWDPKTERFTSLAPMQVPRTYHSLSILLPDGRVLTGGGGLCGGCTTNHLDLEIFSPPYLFNIDGSLAQRPAMTSGVPTRLAAGQSFYVSTDMPISSFALLRLSSITHSVNNEQRRVSLNFSNLQEPAPAPENRSISAIWRQRLQPRRAPTWLSRIVNTNTYQVNLPASNDVLIPGYYMLFAINANGVPSISRTIQIQ
jgi:galactose oxidase